MKLLKKILLSDLWHSLFYHVIGSKSERQTHLQARGRRDAWYLDSDAFGTT
jgi:hypothetical protein